jgi:hypothetical protein
LARETGKTLAGTLTLSGAAVRAQRYFVEIDGALSTAGAIARDTGKAIAGTLSPDGALNRAVTKSYAGAVDFVGAAARQAGKTLAGAVAFVGTVATVYVPYGLITGIRYLTATARDFALEAQARLLSLTSKER